MIYQPPDVDGDPDPAKALATLLGILTPAQFACFVEHCEVVQQHGFGEAWIQWQDGKPKYIYHRASDSV